MVLLLETFRFRDNHARKPSAPALHAHLTFRRSDDPTKTGAEAAAANRPPARLDGLHSMGILRPAKQRRVDRGFWRFLFLLGVPRPPREMGITVRVDSTRAQSLGEALIDCDRLRPTDCLHLCGAVGQCKAHTLTMEHCR